MRYEMSLQGRAWLSVHLARRDAWRLVTSTLLALAFCVAAAHAQPGSKGVPSAGARDESAPVNARTRARRASEVANGNPVEKSDNSHEASDSTSDAAQDAQSPRAEGEAAPPDKMQKGDRIHLLRAQIAGATERSERARLQRTLVDYLIALNRKSEAITELRTMMRENRTDAVSSYNIGNALARLDDTDGAMDAYRKAIDQRHGNYPRALNNLGVMFIRQQRWEEALKALSAAIKQENQRYGEASYNLGRVYGARGQAKLAISEWTRALAVQPDHLDAALALARAYAADGSPERGVAVIDAFVARQGPNKALIETRNEILAGKAGTETKTPSPAPGAKVEAQTAATPVQPS